MAPLHEHRRKSRRKIAIPWQGLVIAALLLLILVLVLVERSQKSAAIHSLRRADVPAAHRAPVAHLSTTGAEAP